VWWGLRRWSQVSGVGFDPSQGQVAAGSVGRRRGTGSPAAALGGGGAAWCDFSPLHAAVGILLKNRKSKTGCWGEKDGGGEHFRRAASRVTPSWTAGGRETGSPHGWQAVRTVEDRVAASVEVSKATGHRRRRAAVRVTPKWTAGGPLPGSHLLSTASPRSHHLLDTGQRLGRPGGPLWRLQGGL
jgi:hypothetical protein